MDIPEQARRREDEIDLHGPELLEDPPHGHGLRSRKKETELATLDIISYEDALRHLDKRFTTLRPLSKSPRPQKAGSGLSGT
jgi:hypothetical protein